MLLIILIYRDSCTFLIFYYITASNGLTNLSWQEQDSHSTHHLFFNQSVDSQVNNRLSNTDSGFMSVQSHRRSNYSKRSSQQSSTSSQWNVQHSRQQMSETVKSESISHGTTCEEQTYVQKLYTSSAYSSSTMKIIDGVESKIITDQDSIPPAIPQKTRRKIERQPSPYDNVPETNLGNTYVILIYRFLYF